MIRQARFGTVPTGKPEGITDVVDDVDATRNMVFALCMMAESAGLGQDEKHAVEMVAYTVFRALEEISERLKAIHAREARSVKG